MKEPGNTNGREILARWYYCLVPCSAQNFAPASIFAPHLVQDFSTANGLPHSSVHPIVQLLDELIG